MKATLPELKINTSSCYQCYTCSLGCPMSGSMDILPHRVVRLVQMGRRAEALQSRTIWQCLNCEMCATRCPRGVDIPGLMDSLRHERLKTSRKRNSVARFHEFFMGGIRQNGIEFELGLLLRLKLSTVDLFSDLGLGLRMLLKGKLDLRPHRSSGLAEIRDMFDKTMEKTR